MASKIFFECGCMEQGDQFFPCNVHRASGSVVIDGISSMGEFVKMNEEIRSLPKTEVLNAENELEEVVSKKRFDSLCLEHDLLVERFSNLTNQLRIVTRRAEEFRRLYMMYFKKFTEK